MIRAIRSVSSERGARPAPLRDVRVRRQRAALRGHDGGGAPHEAHPRAAGAGALLRLRSALRGRRAPLLADVSPGARGGGSGRDRPRVARARRRGPGPARARGIPGGADAVFGAPRTCTTRGRYTSSTWPPPPPPANGSVDRAWLDRLAEAYGEEHERTYGHRAGPEEPVELVNMVLVARASRTRRWCPTRFTLDRPEEEPGGSRSAYFGPEAGWTKTPCRAPLRPRGGRGRPPHRRGVRRHLPRAAGRPRLPRRLRQHRHRPLTPAGAPPHRRRPPEDNDAS